VDVWNVGWPIRVSQSNKLLCSFLCQRSRAGGVSSNLNQAIFIWNLLSTSPWLCPGTVACPTVTRPFSQVSTRGLGARLATGLHRHQNMLFYSQALTMREACTPIRAHYSQTLTIRGDPTLSVQVRIEMSVVHTGSAG